MSNRTAYKKKRIVKIYSRHTELQKPEKTILNILRNELPEMKMLDIGVGGGRTTLHFAKLVKEYVGIDYSEEMIAACKNRFSDYPAGIKFKVCDARDLNTFKDNSFNFILFSFNGIDYVSHDERLKIMAEIRRVLKPNGYFGFSTHNLQSINNLFDFKKQLAFQIHLPKQIIHWFLIRFIFNRKINIRKLKDLQTAIFNDGAERFGVQTYYIKPFEQIKQLQPYFKEVRTFLLKSGFEVNEKTDLKRNNDDWLYYLCK